MSPRSLALSSGMNGDAIAIQTGMSLNLDILKCLWSPKGSVQKTVKYIEVWSSIIKSGNGNKDRI
jgi:hypothetical protein